MSLFATRDHRLVLDTTAQIFQGLASTFRRPGMPTLKPIELAEVFEELGIEYQRKADAEQARLESEVMSLSAEFAKLSDRLRGDDEK